jgi:hypothetical protein
MDDPEFASIDETWRQMDRVLLETYAARLPIDSGRSVGLARAEVIRRDREYTQQQERGRDNFELKMFDKVDMREAARHEFEEKLAQRQMDHASELAKEQLDTAQAAARAAKMAAWAAGVAALGAVGIIVATAVLVLVGFEAFPG